MSEPRIGVLLVNLGTPDAPRPAEVRRYLREFLGDPRVLDMPALARWLLLELVILPRRPRVAARAYAQVWTAGGSPLRVHGEALRDAVAPRLGDDFRVALGMRYGNPALPDAIGLLVDAGVETLVVLPLFPQYSEAATGSVLARVREIVGTRGTPPRVVEIGAFHHRPDFAAAWRAVASPALAAFAPDHVLLSYHGLPERQIRRADAHGHCLTRDDCCSLPEAAGRGCYRAQCHATTRTLIDALGLDPERTTTAFQSRLGRTPWIRPHTDRVLPELHAAGVRRLAVLCPTFVADCLETIEEIGLRARAQWQELGGEALELVPCLNASEAWADAVAAMVRQAAI